MSLSIGELTGYITLDTSGVTKGSATTEAAVSALGKNMAASGAVAGAGYSESFTSKATGYLGTALKAGLVGVATAGGALAAVALSEGFTRLEAIDQAKAKLTGLGNSADTVSTIMDNALAAVKGTAYGLGDAATVSASAVAAGVKPGKELTATLKLVADAATIGGSSLTDMGAIFGKVAASNKVQGDTIDQLNSQGIPILQFLGKQLHMNAAEVSDLASKGKIDFKTFSAAMQAGLGGAALKSGNTFSGAFANVGASLSRVGAGLLGGIFPHLAPMFQGITVALAPLEGKATGVGDAIGNTLGPALEKVGPLLARAIKWAAALDFSHAKATASGFVDAVKRIDFGQLQNGTGTVGSLSESFHKLGSAFKSVDLSQLGASLGKSAADSVSVFAVAVGFAAQHVGTLAKIMPLLVAAFVAYKGAQAAANVLAVAHVPLTAGQIVANLALASSNRALAAASLQVNGIETEGILLRARNTVATVASTVASVAASAASKAMAAGQWLLNAALTANPIGIVVVALAALVAGLIIAYKKSDTFRAIVNGAFHAVADTAGAVVSFIRSHWVLLLSILTGPIGAAVIQIVKHWGAIKAGAQTAWNAIKGAVSAAIGGIMGAVGAIASLPGKFAGWFGAARDAAGKAMGSLLSAVKNLPGKIVASLGNLGHLLFSAGQAIVQGLLDGIDSMIGKVGAKLAELGNKAKDLANKFSGGLMRSSGGALAAIYAQGLAAALSDAEHPLADAMGKIADFVGEQFNAHLDTVSKGIDSKYDKLASGLRKKLKGKALDKALTANDADRDKAQRQSKKNMTAAQQHLMSTTAITRQALAANVAAQQANTDALKDANDALATALQTRDDYFQSLHDSVVSFASLGSVKVPDSGILTGADIVSQLQGKLAAVQAFQKNINTLLGDGIDPTTYQQLVDQGVEAGGTLAQALVDNPAVLSSIGQLQSQIETAAGGLAQQGASRLYQAGVDSAQGLVDGLASQQAALVAQAAALGTAMAAAIADALAGSAGAGKGDGKGKGHTKHQRTAAFATGGRVTGPTFATIGEGREPETVLPDSMLRGLLERAHQGGRASAMADAQPARTGPLIGQVVQQPGESVDSLAERLWFKTRTRG